MTSLIETVARALRMDAMCSHDDMWDTLTQISRDVWRRAAVTALKAMRNPTIAMTLAGQHHCQDDRYEPDAEMVEDAWQAMIDAALAEHDAELKNHTQKVDPIWR